MQLHLVTLQVTKPVCVCSAGMSLAPRCRECHTEAMQNLQFTSVEGLLGGALSNRNLESDFCGVSLTLNNSCKGLWLLSTGGIRYRSKTMNS